MIVARWDTSYGRLRLGELADRVVESVYGEHSLQKFANDVGIAKCVLERSQSVYRAWKSAPAPILENLNYSVAQELQTHPRKLDIIQENPEITKTEARAYRKEHERSEAEADPVAHRQAKAKKWGDGILKIASAAQGARNHHYTPEFLRLAVERKLIPDIREGAQALIDLADQLEESQRGEE